MEGETDNKLERSVVELEEVLGTIKAKLDVLKTHKRFLVGFTTRLETLLKCFEAYSFEEAGEDELGRAENEPREARNELEPERVDGKRVKVDHASRIEEIFRKNTILKEMAQAVFETVKSNEPISLDNLVKAMRHSKYKVIEVLNRLVREKIVVKTFDKVFVYRVSRE